MVGLLSIGCNKSSAPAGAPNSSASRVPARADNGGSASQSAAGNANTAPQPIVIPAGKVLTVRLSQALSSKGSQTGEAFMATLAEPVSVEGQPVIQKGA